MRRARDAPRKQTKKGSGKSAERDCRSGEPGRRRRRLARPATKGLGGGCLNGQAGRGRRNQDCPSKNHKLRNLERFRVRPKRRLLLLGAICLNDQADFARRPAVDDRLDRVGKPHQRGAVLNHLCPGQHLQAVPIPAQTAEQGQNNDNSGDRSEHAEIRVAPPPGVNRQTGQRTRSNQPHRDPPSART